jgi:hypothetical protein
MRGIPSGSVVEARSRLDQETDPLVKEWWRVELERRVETQQELGLSETDVVVHMKTPPPKDAIREYVAQSVLRRWLVENRLSYTVAAQFGISRYAPPDEIWRAVQEIGKLPDDPVEKIMALRKYAEARYRKD